MARQHPTLTSFARRLRPDPERFAAAAALQDPSLLLRARARNASAPLRPVRTRGALKGETVAALLLVAAVVAALLWSNSPWGASYDAFWHAPVSLTVGPWTLGADLRTWIDEGLMTLFFLVVGLEAKRERDLGELRDGRRLTVPVLAAAGGMAVSAGVYLAVTISAGGVGAGGWGVAISTDTALALGALTLVAGRSGRRMHVFMLTLLVVDDVVALLVISVVYPARIDLPALIVAVVLLAALLSMRAIAARQFRARGDSAQVLWALSILAGAGLWLALFESGVDPVISGLLIGLLTNAYEPASATAASSPNDRMLSRLHPWASLLVVPLFALANAGLQIDRPLLVSAATSPITWGIILAYVAGKPLGIVISAWVARRSAPLSLGADELAGTALAAGVGFTVSLLIASRAFDGELLDQAKLGILATAVLAPALSFAALSVAAGHRHHLAAAPAR
jgi:Na+/H+ antiporter NhaA